MIGYSANLFILGIICRIYVNTAKSNSQSAPIISGERAGLGQFPWHVVVVMEETEDNIILCGGSIITHLWILTAAHCINGRETLLLLFGTIDLWDNDNSMNSSIYCVHPEFNTITLDNDIGLIRLPQPVEFNDHIQIIDLVPATEILNRFIGDQGAICGFGRTQDNVDEISQWLMWTTIEIVNNSRCDDPTHPPMPITALCGVGWGGSTQSPCHGDSGGALVWRTDTGRVVQIGIISFVEENMCSQFPSGYTKVSSYLDYINNIINE